MEALKKHDADFIEKAAVIREEAQYAAKHIPKKYALMIALALDIAHNSEMGVRSLSARAREAGATEEELMEVLKICYSVGGVQMLSSGYLIMEKS
jgi:alkylhydroperoxidase/carboxymuconolactone decarboxylase family protein YurZ